jgi:hypothetical protein
MIDVFRLPFIDRSGSNDSEPATYTSDIVGTASTSRNEL